MEIVNRAQSSFAVPIVLALMAFAGTQQARGPARQIVGSWRGTATCANRAKDLTCKDETVSYDVDTVGATHGNVMLRAHRILNHDRQFMYAMQFKFSPAAHMWLSDFTASTFHGRWEYTVNGSVMTGRLIELPSKRLVRRVSVRLSPARRNG